MAAGSERRHGHLLEAIAFVPAAGAALCYDESMSLVQTRQVLATVERAYRLDGTDDVWLTQLLETAAPDLDRGLGLYAATGIIQNEHLVPSPPLAAFRLAPSTAQHALAIHARLPCPVLDAFVPHAVVVGGLDEAWPRRLAAADLYRSGMSGAGVRDAFVAYANDGEGGCVKIIAPATYAVRTHPRVRALWGRVMVHVAAALRLRRRVRAGQAPAVLPTGLRSRVAVAVRRIEAARAGDPERALDVWKGLVAGRFSLVDGWEADGRRYALVYRNDPLAPNPRALGSSERAIVELIGRGASNKEAAYALGVTQDAIAKGLASSLGKLGLGRRHRLAALVTGRAHAQRIDLGAARLDVVVTTATAPKELPSLTAAERQVVAEITRGASNAQIAAARGTTVRTVANQLQRIFVKLGVHSRAELAREALGA